MDRAQAVYKRDFDARLRGGRPEMITPGDFVFVRKEHYNPGREKRQKLSPVADGPVKVISVTTGTIVVKMGDAHERLSRDRVVLAPPPPTEATPATLDSTPEVDTTSGTPVVSRPAVLPHPSRGLSDLPLISEDPAQPENNGPPGRSQPPLNGIYHRLTVISGSPRRPVAPSEAGEDNRSIADNSPS